MDSKKIEELADGAERDIEILNKMYEKYVEIKDDDTIINNICFNLLNAQVDLEEWASYNKNKWKQRYKKTIDKTDKMM